MIKIKKMKMKINSGGDFAFRLNEKIIMVINRQLNDSIILTVIKQIIIDR